MSLLKQSRVAKCLVCFCLLVTKGRAFKALGSAVINSAVINSAVPKRAVLKVVLHLSILICGMTFGTANASPQSISSLTYIQAKDGHRQIAAGVYHGQFIVDKPGIWRCETGTVFDAAGEGNAITIQVPGVRIEGCTIRNWGRNLTEMNAAIFINPRAVGAEIINNKLSGPGFGVWVDATKNVTIENNQIEGDERVRSQDRGNGIHLYAVSGAKVVGNEVWHTRDGIYIDTSNNNQLEGNTLRDLRYGIHYMFSHSNKIIDNYTTRTRTGYALMQSHHLTVVGNRSVHDMNYGILMNYITYSTLRDNIVVEVQQGTSGDSMIAGAEGKGLFIYNSLFNTIANNRFERGSLGIHLTAGSEDNQIFGNAFIENQQQVKYVAVRRQEWSHQGHGNFWSDYLGWDRNGDGIGDVSYEPNDNVDRLLWVYPQVRLLLNSPAIELLRWVQRAFPVMKSPGVQDTYPLMRVPAANLALPTQMEVQP